MTPEDAKRFWLKVEKHGADECWLWNGCARISGYGIFVLNGKQCAAHRISFLIAKGRLPVNMALHTCDVRLCVNPSHIYDGTDQENKLDMVVRKRHGRVHGEAHPNCKLRDADICEIYRLDSIGVSKREIAKRMKVSRATVLTYIRRDHLSRSSRVHTDPDEYRRKIQVREPGQINGASQ